MKKQLKKGFIALALIFTLICVQTLKNNKIGAYAPTNPLTEFNTPNLITDIELISYQDLMNDPYINYLGKKIDMQNTYFEGYEISLIYTYILDLKGAQQLIDNLYIIPIYQNIAVVDQALTLQIDKNSNQQLVNIYELNPNYFEAQVTEVMQVIFMFTTPQQYGKITIEMIDDIALYNYNAELLYEQPIYKDGLNAVFDLINKPIDDLLNYIGIDDTIILSPGFGSITWFEITLRQAIKLVIGLLIGLWFIKFILKLIRKFFSIILGGFTI